MAENIAPPNGSNAESSTDKSSGDDRSPLATLNGKSTQKGGSNVAMIKALREELILERNNTEIIEKDLADLDAKFKKLGQLLDVCGLKVHKLKEELKSVRKTASADLAAEKRLAQKSTLAELNLQKKIHKKEIKLEVDTVKLEVKEKVALTKEVEKEKNALKND
jgi:F0F1-type ATP synthase membrane subunit b/b'